MTGVVPRRNAGGRSFLPMTCSGFVSIVWAGRCIAPTVEGIVYHKEKTPFGSWKESGRWPFYGEDAEGSGMSQASDILWKRLYLGHGDSRVRGNDNTDGFLKRELVY